MRKLLIIPLLGVLALVVAFLVPASGHIGESAHVGNARYNEKQHINFALVPGNHFGPQSKDNVRAAITNLENKLSWPPDLHVRQCEGNPGKCIAITKHDCEQAECPAAFFERGTGTNWIHFFADGTLGQRFACRALLHDFGVHLHEGPGCLNKGPGEYTETISNQEENALDAAYCDACRGDEFSDETLPAAETLTGDEPN